MLAMSRSEGRGSVGRVQRGNGRLALDGRPENQSVTSERTH